MDKSFCRERPSEPLADCMSPGRALEEPVQDHPYARFLGITVEGRASETPVYSMPFREQLIGNTLIGTVHGGILASFAEIVAGLHLQAHQVVSELPECTSMTFDYFRPAFAGKLRADPQTVRVGKRFIVVTVDVLCEQSLVSRGRFIYSRSHPDD